MRAWLVAAARGRGGFGGGSGPLIATAHWTKRAALLLLALAIGFTVFLTVGAAPASAKGGRQTLIYDQFTLDPGQSRDMNGREPDKASIGSVWAVERDESDELLGDWWIVGRKGGKVVERSLGYWEYVLDKRVNIDAETADVMVSSRIKRGDGHQLFGVTARHIGPVDWLGAWFDPWGWVPEGLDHKDCSDLLCSGAIVLGMKDQLQARDGFIELERARFEWREGRTQEISLTVVGNLVTVRVGKRVLIRAQFTGLGDATEVGLFSRGEGDTEFKNFKVTGRDQQEAETAGGPKKPKKPEKPEKPEKDDD